MSLSKMIFGERRLYTRKACLLSAEISDHKKSYACHLRELSIGGALVDPPPQFKPKVGQKLHLNISFHNKPGKVMVKGVVVRFQPGLLAVAFEKSLQSTLRAAS